MSSRLECKKPPPPPSPERDIADDEPHSQLQTGTATGADAYNGMLDCFKKIIRNEGCAPYPPFRPLLPQDSL